MTPQPQASDNRYPQWASDWFGSPYYEMLYRHRDDHEACLFVDNLVRFIPLREGDQVLDMACGRGRHAQCLAKNDLRVDAFDASESCILQARSEVRPNIRFFVHDMRLPFPETGYRAVLNMFTSFGYFPDDAENRAVIEGAARALVPGGTFVLDYLNVAWVAPRLTPFTIQHVDGIAFSIRKRLAEGFIVKTIDFEAEGHTYRFEERVRDLRRQELNAWIEGAGLKVRNIFGDYDLSPYVENASRRLIFIADREAA